MWQKTIAGMLVIIGTFGFGRALCNDINCVLYHLKEQRRMLTYIINEISFMHKPMQEIFEIINEKLNEPYKTFIKNILKEMDNRNGIKLEDIWKKEVKNIKNTNAYPQKAVSNLLAFKSCFGEQKDKMQIEAFRMFEAELCEEINRLSKEKAEKCKLIQTLSILTGVFCVILFI